MLATTTPLRARLDPEVRGDTVFLNRKECQELGGALHDEYVNNSPYPHVVLENFLPAPILRRIVDEFPKRETGRFSDAHSTLKTGYQLERIGSAFTTNVIDALNSSQFIDFLEAMTGIRGLMPDPHQLGGGLHETARGGHLSIHADFNFHPRMKVRRRMNLILFLNEQWDESYGGALELWKSDMSACEKAVLPILGRAVIFNTDKSAYHGHPDPLACPDHMYRRSLALYYYTAPDAAQLLESSHTTDFRMRPGTADKPQIATKVREFARDLVPPLLYRALLRKGRRAA